LSDRTGRGLRKGALAAALLGLFGAGAYLAIGGRGGAGAEPPERIALGREVYDRHCAACHRPDLVEPPTGDDAFRFSGHWESAL
jgi:mono/diheme cytochrome c family protein